jgi:uncharacterized protein (TIGR03382 family)
MVWTKQLVAGTLAIAALASIGGRDAWAGACATDGDCKTAPNLHCDGTLDGECVECLADDHCAAGTICETDVGSPSRGKCVECTALDDSHCSPGSSGRKCIGTTDSCGCVTDGDCGDEKSGRVCDESSTRRCIEGCREAKGNGCPSDQRCSSTNEGIGKCAKSVGNDGGADGGDGGNGLVSLDSLVAGGGCSCTANDRGEAPVFGTSVGIALGLAALARRRRSR